MKMFAPKYVKNFKCIAERCQHSCCVGWEIDIDMETLRRYQAKPDKRIMTTVEKGESGELWHFRLGSDSRCANLTKEGLCRIICEHGEDYIPEICREHPRFYNRTRRGIEAGIGMSCEEACRIILTSDEYEIVPYKDAEINEDNSPDFDSPAEIDRIYGILSKRSISYEERLSKIFELYEIPQSILANRKLWNEVFSSLEYLHESHERLFQKYDFRGNENDAHAILLERALAYFIYRHASPADSPQDFKPRLILALLFERLYASLLSSEENLTDDIAQELARVISEELEYSEFNTETLLFEIEFLL